MNVSYKRLSLRPYPGEILLFSKLPHLRAYYASKTREAYPYDDEPEGGRFIRLDFDGKNSSKITWLVYAVKPHVKAHEFGHVLLHTFKMIGSDPWEGNGEPFCYMMSQLMLDAG